MKQDTKRKVIRRLRIIEGQIRGLQNMIEHDAYCIHILHQSAAVKEALSGVEDLVLEKHLKTHVVDQVKRGKEEKAINEILTIYKLSRKKI
ncbi:MAG: metal-sensitive transcriptional regulator [Patescibacteria group bacterium]